MKKSRIIITDKYDHLLDDDEIKLWENGKLGMDPKYIEVASPEEEKALDDSLGLAPISIRLQKTLVAKLKKMAKEEGLVYQAYIRQILTRHAKGVSSAKEKKRASR